MAIKSLSKNQTHTKNQPTHSFHRNKSQQASQSTNPFGKPYLRHSHREPQVTPGMDSSLNPALSCKYYKDTGHDVSNCAKVKRKEGLKAAAASSTIKHHQKEKLGRLESGDHDSSLLKIYDPKQFLGKCVYNDSELDILHTTGHMQNSYRG